MAKKAAKKSTDVRELTYSDGKSNKFWKIEIEGASHTVTFGRVGTDGQSRTKDFGREDDAKKSFDKLVAEKLKKGYADGAGPPSGVASAAKPVGKAAAVSSQSQEAAPVDLKITSQIDLEPEDWFRAGFRRSERLERGKPAPFDKDDCLNRLSKLKTVTYGWDVRWNTLKLPPALSAEEAHFWLVATTKNRKRDTKMPAFAKSVGTQKFNGKVGIDEARKLLRNADRGVPEETAIALANLLSPDQFLELMLDKSLAKNTDMGPLVDGFSKYVAPYLTDRQLQAIRKRIRKNWDPTQMPDYYDPLPVEYYVAAGVGLHDEVYQITSNWPDDRYLQEEWCDHYQRPQDLVFGLGSAETVESEWRRLRLKMRAPEHVRAFLACTELTALDCIADSICAQTNREECEALIKTFVLVRAPEAAEPMLQCKQSSKVPAVARDWLDHYVGNAVAGLIDVAGGRGKLADAAIEYLRSVKRRGHESVIANSVKKAGKSDAAAKVRTDVLEYEEKVYEPFDGKTTPKWLSKELNAVAGLSKALPGWANASTLPPLVIGDRRLNDEQVALVLQLLVATPVSERHSLFAALRKEVSKPVRDEFAWKLFQLWLEDGYPPKQKWAMGAIGHLGDDQCVLKLTPMIRAWPGESQHARAVFGLECLRAIGSSIALMQLSGIAQKLKFKGLKAKAQQFVGEIAEEKGMTRDELEDRVVPDCGLDENGRREFSFGPRSFSFVLSGDLKAMVRDEGGKVRPNLPKPGAKDDATQAGEATAEWKVLKKQIKEVATIQGGRLEQAMVTGRRWNQEDFESLFVRHPLMTHLAQKLIWGGFDDKGKRLVTFRVTEERDYADPDDNGLSLPKAAVVGVVHPLELADAERARWGEVMSDYEIVSPFPQLGREVYTLEKGEGKTDDLERFHDMKLVAPTLVFTLEKLGWVRGVAMDGGCFDEHSKQFPAADMTAVVGYEGVVGMGYIDPNEMLTVDSIHFCPGMRPPSGYGWGSKKKLKLAKVPPIVISEVIADLQVLKSKAK